MERTGRLGLPLLVGGQAGKEVTHNEALLLLDALVGGVVDAVGVDAPPAEPEVGRCWIVGGAPTGAWAGQAGAVACRTTGGWRFIPASDGLALTVRGSGLAVRYVDGAWRAGEAIAEPASGSMIDVEARAAIGAMLDALRAHGLIEA